MKRFSYILLLVIIFISLMIVPTACHKPDTAILFVGDSITEQYRPSKFIKDYECINEGIYGEFSSQTKARFSGLVEKYQPEYISLLIGTNDFYDGISHEIVLANICAMVEQAISAESTKYIFVHSVLPINTDLRQPNKLQNNPDICDFNNKLKSKLSEYDKAVYVDTYSQLVNSNGILDKSYTNDGLHISNAGYSVISKYLLNTIKNTIDNSEENSLNTH